jgi:hypothetical protein
MLWVTEVARPKNEEPGCLTELDTPEDWGRARSGFARRRRAPRRPSGGTATARVSLTRLPRSGGPLLRERVCRIGPTSEPRDSEETNRHL